MSAANNLKVLIISGDQQTTASISKILNREGFNSENVASGEKALERIWSNPPSFFLLLHLELSGMSGLDVLRILRQDQRTANIPVITFSDEADQAKILTAFNLEVNDYITKPFHPEELVARVKAVMNRRGPIQFEKEDILVKGKIQVHPAYHKVFLDKEEVKLTPKEYQLLLLLMQKEGRILSRVYLLEAIWQLPKDVTTRSVDMLVARLRKKLKKEGARWIETVQSYGYRIPTS